jgi:hypothetical protein
MKATIESTTKTVHMNGVPARIWEGETESGIKFHCYITRVGIAEDETRTAEFEAELAIQRKPSVEIESIPLRLIL